MTGKEIIRKTAVIGAWVCLWQLLSMFVKEKLILAGPVDVLQCLFELAKTPGFYHSVFYSFIKIICGFFCAFSSGILAAFLAYRWKIIRELLAPVVYLMKILPMVSFIILLLIWLGAKNISLYISFLVAFPVIYTGTSDGLNRMDDKLLEVTQVFHVSTLKKIRYLYVFQIYPYITSNCKAALGMCWKAGISAEVIGLSINTVGEQMYFSKLYLMTDMLLAWSLTIIVVSAVFEKIFIRILGLVRKGLEK